MTRVSLRALTGDDIPTVQALFDACSAYFVTVSGLPAAPQQAETEFRNLSGHPGRVWLGLFLPDPPGAPSLVGLADLRLNSPTSQQTTIGQLLVHEDQRRRGYGSQAYRLFEGWLAQQSIDRVLLYVPGQAFGAQQFWRTLGFEFSGQQTRVGAGRKSLRLLEMVKRLKGEG